MAVLDDMVTYLEQAGVGLTRNVNLFASVLPDLGGRPDDEAKVCVAVVEVAGRQSVYTMSGKANQAVMERPSIQVRCRAVGYAAARGQAQLIYQTLNGAVDWANPDGLVYHYITALQPPYPLQVDEQDRKIIACDYTIERDTEDRSVSQP